MSFQESDLEKYGQTLPPDWAVHCGNDFNSIRDVNNEVTRDSFDNYLKEYLKTCPKSMADTVPGLDEFFGRYSGDGSTTRLTEQEFKNFWRETYLLKKTFENPTD
jgi:hypothetical protein